MGSFFAEIFTSQGAPLDQLHQRKNFPLIKLADSVNEAGGKLPPKSMTTAVNLPSVSVAPVAKNGNNIRLLRPLIELREKNYLYVPSTFQRCPNKIV
jgi:hypothetical protein